MNEVINKMTCSSMEYNAAKKIFTVTLPDVEKGWYVTAELSTQASNTGNFEIYEYKSDVKKTLMTGAKNNKTYTFQQIEVSHNGVLFDGDELKLSLHIDTDSSIMCSDNDGYVPVKNPYGETIGKIYVYCFEDYTDNDYNDFVFTIGIWKARN